MLLASSWFTPQLLTTYGGWIAGAVATVVSFRSARKRAHAELMKTKEDITDARAAEITELKSRVEALELAVGKSEAEKKEMKDERDKFERFYNDARRLLDDAQFDKDVLRRRLVDANATIDKLTDQNAKQENRIAGLEKKI